MIQVQPTLFPDRYQDQVLETRTESKDWRPCLVCRRLLKNPQSIERGMGAACAQKTAWRTT